MDHLRFVKSMRLIFLNKNAQKLNMENKIIPINPADSHERSLFLLRSFGVQIARKSDRIHRIERMNITTPKLPLINFFRRLAISFGLIPKILIKKVAWSGLKTM